MVIQNLILTLIVAAAASYTGWEFAPSSWSAVNVLGICLAVVGFSFWTLARFQLGKSFTVTAQARQLVKQGIYSKIRNPIYVFGSMFIVGYILMLGRPAWLLIFVVIIPMQIWRVRKEARVLEAKFGDEYRTYRARTWF
jgi:protein-S-isoprenylcysteine O-methyltransferase Ste14